MARNHHRRKLRTYHSLSSINHHFQAIVRHCWALEKAGYMPIVKMATYRGLVRELQAQISREALSAMLRLENRDFFEFGKVRIAREHYLNSNRPAFRQGNTDRKPQ